MDATQRRLHLGKEEEEEEIDEKKEKEEKKKKEKEKEKKRRRGNRIIWYLEGCVCVYIMECGSV